MRKAVKVELPLGRTTLTAANGEYDEESGTYPHREAGRKASKATPRGQSRESHRASRHGFWE